MDLNLVVLAGRLAAPPEITSTVAGRRLVRYLVTVTSKRPKRRVDVLPVTQWADQAGVDEDCAVPGRRIWVAGAAQRRFWDAEPGRRSRLEIVAHQIEIRSDPPD